MYQLMIICMGMLLSIGSQNDSLFTEHFDYPDGQLPKQFWSEGNLATVRNGRLFIDADTVEPRASTLWLKNEINGDVSVEFDVYLVSSADDANNVNLFFMYNNGPEERLEQTAAERQDALYRRYHSMNGYIFTNVTNKDSVNIRYRFRKNPGFKLLTENHSSRTARGDKIHIKLIKKNNQFEYWENGKKMMEVYDPKPYDRGHFGFRTWHTALEIDNLLIKRI